MFDEGRYIEGSEIERPSVQRQKEGISLETRMKIHSVPGTGTFEKVLKYPNCVMDLHMTAQRLKYHYNDHHTHQHLVATSRGSRPYTLIVTNQ